MNEHPVNKTIRGKTFANMEEAGVAVVPGSGFLADGFIRISYAAAEAELTAACSAIHAAVNKLA